MSYKVTLRKIFSNHEKLRTDKVSGLADTLPEVGKNFNMYGESLSVKGEIRVVVTSLVKELTMLRLSAPQVMLVKTENSVYELTYEKE